MKQQGFSSRQVVRTAERFFRSLGFRELPPTFWNSSLFDQPLPPREAVCHASAWDFTSGVADDVRLKMCVDISEEDLVTAHHELGHIYYYLAYQQQPLPFRTGANDGFHEGIGDTLALSCNSAYLRQIGILPPEPSPDPKLELQTRVNHLMKMALDKIAFLPFGFAVDAYRCSASITVPIAPLSPTSRWSIFNGSVSPSSYTSSWWKLRQQFQGIAPAVPRSDPLDFDAGAKYHVAANVPYMRYFLAHILQFQFHAALCEASGHPAAVFHPVLLISMCDVGHSGPLDECSVYGSAAAGQVLQQMLRSGASLPWQDVLRAMTGNASMSTRPLLRYFQPLHDFLYRQNRLQPTAIGWGDDFYISTQSSPASAQSSGSSAGSVVLGIALALIILWIAFQTRRQMRMRHSPIVCFEDINDFGFSSAGHGFHQI
jgi:peptidyl-dipeptidase A